MNLKPLYIFSLPRSGSTLFQRVLAADSQISTVAEPWVLLPFIYALRKHGVNAEYGHNLANHALSDFFQELPNGRQDYLSAIGTVMCELYQKATKNKDAQYFLDKTPRYALIAHEIIDIFPDGKFIILWRNPLSIIASIIETWGEGKWNISRYNVDLYDGMANLIDCSVSEKEKILVIQYERFLREPENELSRISEYLELKLDPDVLNTFSKIRFRGKMGDSTGVKNYSAVNTAPIEKWKTVINNPLRKMWCRRYLRWLGEERLKIMGYDLNMLLHELNSTPTTLRDLYSDGVIIINFKARIKNILCKLARF